MHSKWLGTFDGAIMVNGKVLAFNREVEEFVFTEQEQPCKSTFWCAVPKKVVFDLEHMNSLHLVDLSKGFSCVELRNPKIIIDEGLLDFVKVSESIVVTPDHEYYCSIDGVLFTKDQTKLLIYPYLKKDREYTIPEGVLEIDYTFCPSTFCKVIHLPSTLRELYSKCGFSKVEEVIFPEVNSSFRFSRIGLNNVSHLEIPASIKALPFDSFHASNAVVDATQVQYFMRECITCKELYISDEMKFADEAAFCNVEILHTPEHKIFNFAKTLLLAAKVSYTAPYPYKYFCCVIVTMENGKLLHLKLPDLDKVSESAYYNTIVSFWSVNGISVDKYLNAIMQISMRTVKCDALCYFIEKNVELCDLLLPSISKVADGIIPLLIENEKFDTISVLCKNDLLAPSVIRKFLQKDLPNELIPVFMSALQDSESINLNL